MRTKIWTTKTGQRIRIMDMETSHIQNCVNLIYRAAAKLHNHAVSNGPPCFQGEMAQMYAEQEWEALSTMSMEDFAEQSYPIVTDLLKELDDRKHGRAEKGKPKCKK